MAELTSFPINTKTFEELEVVTDSQATDDDGLLFFDESVGVMKRMTRGELFKGKVIPLDSIAVFSGLDTDSFSDRQQFHLNSFAPDGESGGGPLLWNPDLPKSLHDGVRYFSPTVPVPADFDSPTDVQNYMDGVGEEWPAGDGVFVLTLFSIQSSEFPAINNALVQFDGVSGNTVKNGPVPSLIGTALIQAPSITEVSYHRLNADETVSTRTLAEHKADLSINNVDNTSDANKPISTATQSALDDIDDDVAAVADSVSDLADAVSLKAATTYVDAADDALQAQIDARVQSVATIADLRLLTGLTVGQQVSVSNQLDGGLFTAIAGAAADDNVVIYETADGVRVQRNDIKFIHVDYAGVTGSGTETTKLQQAINAAIAYQRKLLFDGSKTYTSGVLSINGNISIDFQGASTVGTGNGFFQQTADTDYIHITGLKSHTWSSQTGTIGKQFIWNTTATAGSTAFASDLYNCKDFKFTYNKVGASKVEMGGALTKSTVEKNEWVTNDTVSCAPAYLFLSRGDTDTDSGPVYVEENIFDVWGVSGSNKDIVKIGGGISGGHFHGNKVKNRNLASDAQVDVFTGAHKMQFAFNDLVNVQLHRKQVQGAIPAAPTLYAMDNYLCNTFTQEDGWVQTRSVYHIGNLAKYIGNSFDLQNTVEACIGIAFDRSDVDTGYDTDAVVANIVALNMFNLEGGHVGSDAVVITPATIGSSGSRWMQVVNNIQISGDKLLGGGSQSYSVLSGNIFGYSTTSTGTGINGGITNIVAGNVADTANVTFSGIAEGNIVNQSIPTLAAGATPDVSDGDKFFINSATNITDFVGGRVGKEITLFTAGPTTIINSSTIRMLASANYVATSFNQTIKFVRVTSTQWRQV